MLSSQLIPTSEQRMTEYIDEVVANLDLVVSHDDLFNGSEAVVLSLFPDWQTEDVSYVQFKDGITNKLICCTHGPSDTKILVRAYGKKSEVIIDRKQEIMNMVILSTLGLCPPLYGRFKNGLAYGCIPGDVFKVADMREPHKMRLVAKKLATWHASVTIPGERTSKLFPTIRKWIHEVPETYSKPAIQQVFADNFDMKQLHQELDTLETHLLKLKSPVVFCHNDLLYGNLIYDSSKDDVFFIDYEYGSYSYRAFDIANHFNEWCGFECEYENYPCKEVQMEWLSTYLSAGQPEYEVKPEDVEQLYREVNKFALASHFYWGVWALVQAQLSDIDFDYMPYAVLRFNEYFKRRDEFLAL
ncbi:Ethanolamine kinase [Actinomortierella ambigua]|uniref:ethanolamine kinase n=1 Tax=Actinomortierella ambigua TaxID=1343610 RepID=A0A9P6U9R2_9FUNG|nr:Ethanolamine kinase [Actinomortierella ambigua]KAG0265299.1 Ethanolamine kinase [Actinomortierella ambigua]